MGKGRWIDALALGLIALGLLAAAPVLWQRWQAEGASRQVDLVLDLPSYRALARQEGYPLERLLSELKEAGATSLAIPEMDLEALEVKGLAAVRRGAELRQDLAAMAAAGRPDPLLSRLAASGLLDDGATYLLPTSPEARDRLYRALVDRLGPERVRLLPPEPGEPGVGVIELTVTPEVLEITGAGFDPADFELARRVGLRPVPRPRAMPGGTEEGVRTLFREIETLAPDARVILFGARVLPGWRPDRPEVFATTVAEMQRRGYILGMVEDPSQLGFTQAEGQEVLAPALDYRVARVYSMTQKELDKYLPHDGVEKMTRAVLERNIRMLYLRPLRVWQDPGLTVVETNLKYLRLLVERLRDLGFAPGEPGLYTAYHTPWWQRGLIGLAPVGAGVLWLGMTWPFRQRFLLLLALLGSLGSFGLVYVAPRTGAQALALATAVIFPTLAGTRLLVRWRASARYDVLRPGGVNPLAGRSLWREGLAAFATLAGISLVGGLLVAGMLGDIRYLLEFDYFRGVKLSLVAPLALVAFSYLTLDRTGHPVEVARQVLLEVWDLLGQSVRFRHVILGFLGLVAIFYYVQRSGNFPVVPVSELELEMRAALERLLIARPRTKEFAVAYPALALAVVAAVRGYRGWILPLLLAAMTGGSSIVNTFSHLRTPWAISLLRTVHGFWLGGLVGLVVAGAALMLLRWLEAGGKAEAGRKGSSRP